MTVAEHESPRTTKLYDRTRKAFTRRSQADQGFSDVPFVDAGPTCHFATSILNPRRAEGDGLW